MRLQNKEKVLWTSLNSYLQDIKGQVIPNQDFREAVKTLRNMAQDRKLATARLPVKFKPHGIDLYPLDILDEWAKDYPFD